MNEMNHLPKKGEIVSEYKGVKVFQLTPEEFNQVTGRRKYERWSKTLGESPNLGIIKSYSLKRPGNPIIVQNKDTGEMKMIRRRLNDQRLKHNRKNRNGG
jgi:hypothetical protein